MLAVGDAGIGGDPAQLEKAMILGDDFILSMVVDPTMSMPFLSRFIRIYGSKVLCSGFSPAAGQKK